MSQSICEGNDVITGGVIQESTITDSDITGSRISGSSITNSALYTVSDIDAPTAKLVADAITSLSAEQLAALAKAIITAYAATPVAAPATTQHSATPTVIVGGRTQMLGAPAAWMDFGSYVVPCYAKS